MSHSKEVTEYKRKLIYAIKNSAEIVNAIGEPDITVDNSDDLINLCLFDYNKIPSVQETARTYITIQVNVPRIDKDSIWRETVVVIRTIVHDSKMDLSGKGNRMDYISSQLDELLSGREDFGYGRLLIASNVEGAINEKFMARTMTFTSTNNNMSFCGN